jgi:hypothetical protein
LVAIRERRSRLIGITNALGADNLIRISSLNEGSNPCCETPRLSASVSRAPSSWPPPF